MDAAHFDRLTVAFAGSGPRRSVLALLSAVGVRALVVAETHAQACGAVGRRCSLKANPTNCCSGICRKRRRRRGGKCAPCPDVCCTSTHCGTGKVCCGGTCHQCCVNPTCQAIDPKLRCCAGECVECCDVGQCPVPKECSGNVCGVPPECARAGDDCTPDGPNADCCGGACHSGACGQSAQGQQCVLNSDCVSGLVCRGFVCTTP
jgi:hypothetical protein